ncbi:histidinol-phosphate transaminase [Halosegnis sp.]|uniref:histidinol-phosphate transaminase n=1 Tax=Halosegnis sp. TaxID=2864959 RepID=UPI0035D407EB
MEPRDLSAHVPYEAGRGIEETARELGVTPEELTKLSSNENAWGPSPKAVVALREAAATVHAYPKASHANLTEQLANRFNVTDEQVWVANGGDGALDYLARALIEPGDRVLVSEPGFAYYAMSARFHHGRVNHYPLEKADGFAQTADRVLDSYDGERIVYVTSPHNPAGTEMPLEEVERLADQTADRTLVVVDEAYAEFSESPSAVKLVRERDDVAVLRTFSKVYGLAGCRLGYALVPPAWGDAYARINTPFAASELACRAGLAALEDDEHVEKTVKGARRAREYMYDNLECRTFESQGNFVLAEVGDGTRVFEAAKQAGVIVRDTTSFGLPECVRITCGTPAMTERAVEAVNDAL